MSPGLESGTPDQIPYRPLLPKYTTSEPSSPNQLPSIWSLRLPEVKPRISSLKMNQMASLVMGMSREQAVKSDEDALRVWNLWMNLVRTPVTCFLSLMRNSHHASSRIVLRFHIPS